MLLALALACLSPQASALGTSYEAKIGGFIYASLHTIIVGEFAGRKISQVDAPLQRPVCRPNDFEDLRATGKDNAAFDAFHRRCKYVEVRVNDTHVVGTAYIPSGHCETLKRVYNNMLAEHVYAVTDTPQKYFIEFEYKGSRYYANDGALARGAQLQTKCNEDGSLSIAAPRKRPRG